MTEMNVRISGLTKLETKELEKEPGIRFEKDAVPEGSHGEVILFVAIFSMSALTTLAAYLLRKHENKSFEETVEVVHPDGRVERKVIRYKHDKTQAPDAAIIGQIRGPV